MDAVNNGFLAKYRFDPKGAGLLGVEIEYFLAYLEDDFRPAPDSPLFLAGMGSEWGYELSACQVEYHTEPVGSLIDLGVSLVRGWEAGVRRAAEINRKLVACELAPEDMNLAIYPHDERYARIAAKLPIETLRAANRVAGTHIHIGAGSVEEALEIHNALAKHTDEFLTLGDHSNGERIRLYKTMAPKFASSYYESALHFCQVAEEQKFVEDPRSCYHFVRLNPKGTVEVRAFGTTDNVVEILSWVLLVKGYGSPS